MYKQYISLLSFLATLFLFLGCTRDEVRTAGVDKSQSNTVYFSLRGANASAKTRSSLPVIAEARESAINRLHAIFFYSDSTKSHIKGQFYKTVECTPTGVPGGYKIENVLEGKYFFYLVANASNDLVVQMSTKVNHEEEFFLLIEKDLPGDVPNITNFLMLSRRQVVETSKSQAAVIQSAIQLERAAVRYDIYNEVEGLVIDEIKFNNRHTATYISAPVGAGKKDEAYNAIRRLAKSCTYKNLNLVGDPTLTSEQSKCIGRIYSYEYLRTNEAWFDFYGTLNGKKFLDTPGIVLQIQPERNKVYSITIKKVAGNDENPKSPADRFAFDLQINDWSQGERVDYTVPGSGEYEENPNGPDEKPILGEDDLVKNYLDYSVELPYASFNNPYLVRRLRYNSHDTYEDSNNFKEVYTLTKEDKVIYLKVRTRENPVNTVVCSDPSLKCEKESSREYGTNTKLYQTVYKITLPKLASYSNPSVNASGSYVRPKYKEFELTISNASGHSQTLIIKHGTPRLDLDYMAEKNLAPLPNFSFGNHKTYNFSASTNYQFAQENDIEHTGFIPPYIDVVNKLKDITIDGKRYRLARSESEWTSMLPVSDFYGESEEFMSLPSMNKQGVRECELYSNVEYRQSRDASNYRIVYAIKNSTRYPELKTAYRYEWVGKMKDWRLYVQTYGLDGFTWDPYILRYSSSLKITSRRLGPNFHGSVDNIANEAFWQTNTELDVNREVPYAEEVNIRTNRVCDLVGGTEQNCRYAKLLVPKAGQATYFVTEKLPFPNGRTYPDGFTTIYFDKFKSGTATPEHLIDLRIVTLDGTDLLYKNTPAQWQKVNEERTIHRFFPIRLIEIEP